MFDFNRRFIDFDKPEEIDSITFEDALDERLMQLIADNSNNPKETLIQIRDKLLTKISKKEQCQIVAKYNFFIDKFCYNEIRDTLDTKQNGTVKITQENYVKILSKLNSFSNVVFDEVKECLCRKVGEYETEPLTDGERAELRLEIEKNFEINSRGFFEDALLIFGGHNKYSKGRRYNPIKAKIESVEWDGTERIERLFIDVLKCSEPEPYLRECARLIFAQLINLVYNPDMENQDRKAEEMIVLHGLQGQGKSTLCKWLALLPSMFNDNMCNITSKNQAIGESTNGKLIVECQEMDCFSGADDGRIKAFLSSPKWTYRGAYARQSVDHKRTCIFIGTTNKQYCLPEDLTGNRRFLPLTIVGTVEDLYKDDRGKTTKEYILQCYAEALHKFRNNNPDMMYTNLNYKKNSDLKKIIKKVQENATPIDETISIIRDGLRQAEKDQEPLNIYRIGVDFLNKFNLSSFEKQQIREVLIAEGWIKTDRKYSGAKQNRYTQSKLWTKPDFSEVQEPEIDEDSFDLL